MAIEKLKINYKT